MSEEKYKFSDDFINQVFLASEGFLSKDDLDKIFESFANESEKYFFTASSESNLIRILNSVYDKISFLRDCLKYPHHIEILTAVAANSNYLTDIIVRNPEYLYQVFGQDYLSEKIEEEKLSAELIPGMERYKSFNARLNFLRLYKRRNLLKIGLNDILGNYSLPETTSALSILAKSICRILFDESLLEVLKKYNLNDVPNKYSLVALGKLGGNELNYSSDVDLIIFFDKNNFIEEVGKEYFEILSEAVLLFIKSSSEVTGKGYLFRVDFRLRPDGKNSPLCRTINDYLRYYETKGEDWERQMLIKADFVGGDEKLYHQFYDYLTPFIYPSSFPGNILLQIRKMKNRIEENLGKDDDIKLIPGGMRDIEFSVQALQLLNGGKHEELRIGSTLEAIKNLRKLKLLDEKEAEIFVSAYVLYRKIEHYMQLMNDTQTHQIPSDREMMSKLSSFLDYSNSSELESEINNYRAKVRSIFNSIVGEKAEQEQSSGEFRKINFANLSAAEKNIKFLRKGIGLLNNKQFDTRTIELFLKVEPSLVEYLRSSTFPDLTLDNFTKFINSVKIVSIWYKEFSNKDYLFIFLKLCEFSDKFIHLVTFDRTLNELYLSGRVFQKEIDYSKLNVSQLHFILAAKFALDLISVEDFSTIKRNFIEEKISIISEKYNFGSGYFIAALGSFGSNEMNFASDVDLIVVNSEESYSETIQKECKNFLLEINRILFPIKVDLRLRPEGSGSQLVWSLDEYKKYLSSRARIWEFQAFTKIRFVKGSKLLFDEFVHSIISSLKDFDSEKIQSEIISIYDKVLNESSSAIKEKFDLKKSRGSLLDIQYLIQFLLLINSGLLNYYLGKNSIEILNGLRSLLDEKIVNELIQNYKFYKMLELSIQTVFDNNNSLIPIDRQKQLRLAHFLGIESPDILRKKVDEISHFNHKIFNVINTG